MPDNNPTSWPPSPAVGETEVTKPPANGKAGWASLVLIAIGIATTSFWYQDGTSRDAAMPSRPLEVRVNMEIIMPLYYLPFWSILALVCGFSGRRSIPGKVGIALALAALAFIAAASARAWFVYHVKIW